MTPDFESMQAQAIKYAQEMQKKSTYRNNHNIPDNNDEFSQKNGTHTQSYNHTTFKHASGIKNIFNANDDKIDNDILIILLLLLLLTQDGGDKMLMLALMYIMT